MKSLTQHIQEGLRINKSSKKNIISYAYKPKDKNELRQIIKERLEENPNADLNDIDVSQITDMSKLFQDLDPHDPHNIDISGWDVSHVENMYCMFCECKNFNCDLSEWDVSKVTNMSFMFSQCYNFNCDLSNWNVSNVENMESMFEFCHKFKGKGLEKWDVSKVTKMESMFDNCKKFNCDLSKWNVKKVRYMRFIFYGCDSLKNKPSWYKG